MKLLTDLFSTDYGLMSLIIIVLALVAMLWFAYFIYDKTQK